MGLRFPVWVSVFLLGKQFLNESSFWGKPSFSDVDLLFGCQSSCWEGKSSSWVCELLFGCQPSCWEDIFLMSLLSGASLPVGFVICCLGAALPVGKAFS